MPELPEVEALARDLDVRLSGHRVERIDILGVATLKTFHPSPQALVGAEVVGVTRRGKFLIVDVSPHQLVLHLARSGWVRWHDTLPSGRAPRSAVAARVGVGGDSGFEITEAGTEKRVALYIADAATEIPAIARLGIDALDPRLDVALLATMLTAAGGTRLKTWLSDQRVIAGIGNAYSDEILHAARLSPFAATAKLATDEVTRLSEAVHGVMSEALDVALAHPPSAMKAAKRAELRVHGRTGEPCPACGTTIRQVDLGSRSLQYCPACQTGGRVYADRRLSRLLR